VRRAVAILLLALIGCLPAVDAAGCPDGCTAATHASASWEHGGVCDGAPACGLCINACFLHRDPTRLIPLERIVSLAIVSSPELPVTIPSLIERPPRLD
jgi:hypothetical protein